MQYLWYKEFNASSKDIVRYYERPQNPWTIQTNDAHLSFMEISTCLVLDTSMTTGVKGLYFGFYEM